MANKIPETQLLAFELDEMPWAKDDNGDPIVGTLEPGYVFWTDPEVPAESGGVQYHILHSSNNLDALPPVEDAPPEEAQLPAKTRAEREKRREARRAARRARRELRKKIRADKKATRDVIHRDPVDEPFWDDVKDHCVETSYLVPTDVDGETVEVLVRQKKHLAAPTGGTLVETDLVPQIFAGQEPLLP